MSAGLCCNVLPSTLPMIFPFAIRSIRSDSRRMNSRFCSTTMIDNPCSRYRPARISNRLSANGLRYYAALPLRFVFLYRDSGFTLLRQRSDERRSHLV